LNANGYVIAYTYRNFFHVLDALNKSQAANDVFRAINLNRARTDI